VRSSNLEPLGVRCTICEVKKIYLLCFIYSVDESTYGGRTLMYAWNGYKVCVKVRTIEGDSPKDGSVCMEWV
jgi:hypothetical protein